MSVEFCVREREGLSILVFHEPKFAVIEISWPGNRRHSVEQSLRYRRLVYRIISSIISRYQTCIEITEKRIGIFFALGQLFISTMDPQFFRRVNDPRRKGFQSMGNNLNLFPQLYPTSFDARKSSLCIGVEVKELRLMPAVRKEKQVLSWATLLTQQFLTYLETYNCSLIKGYDEKNKGRS